MLAETVRGGVLEMLSPSGVLHPEPTDELSARFSMVTLKRVWLRFQFHQSARERVYKMLCSVHESLCSGTTAQLQ